jgi:hypothetical protein
MNARFNYADLDSNARSKLSFEAAFSGSGHVGVLDMGQSEHDAAILIDEGIIIVFVRS